MWKNGKLTNTKRTGVVALQAGLALAGLEDARREEDKLSRLLVVLF
jgi:hypothetical protein